MKPRPLQYIIRAVSLFPLHCGRKFRKLGATCISISSLLKQIAYKTV